MQPVEAAATADAAASDERLMLVVPIGTEHAAGNAVTWKPGQQSNGFFLILGASGSGKTETLKVLGTPIAETGIPVLVFDFHGDVILPGARLCCSPRALPARLASIRWNSTSPAPRKAASTTSVRRCVT